jgi:phenylacetate-CoA ligase
MCDLSVVCPCYNESKNIPVLITRLQNTFDKKQMSAEVVLVDDASSDNTKEVFEDLQKQYQNLVFVSHQKNKGIAESWKDGLKVAQGTYVCFMDADLQNLPEDVWRLYKEIIFTHFDVVSGWRNHVEIAKDSRYLVSKFLNWFLNFLFRMRLRDNKSGFVIARKEIMEHILSHRFNYHHFQTFITISAKAKNYSFRQIETLFDTRRAGKSYLLGKSFWKASWQTFVDVIKGFFEFCLLDDHDHELYDFVNKNKEEIKHQETKKNGWRKLLFFIYKKTFPLHHWMIGSQAVEYFDDLNKSQWLPASKIKEYQEKRLKRLINHVYYHVPYYREIFDKNNLRVEDIRTIEDLQKLPIMDKNVVRENLYLGLMSDSHNKKKIQKVTTSGSTGEPFFTFVEKKQLEMMWAATLRSVEWTGYKFGDRQLRLWHKYLGMKWPQIIREVIDAKLTRRSFIPAYEMDEAGLEKFMTNINQCRPVLIDGYAESFNFIAKYLKSKSYNGHKPKAIISSAQNLSLESRDVIENVFGCKVFDKYGSREFGGGLAYECEHHNGHHIVAECLIVEIVKDGRPALPGEVGEVLVTSLNNFAVPLLRYRLGDLAVQMDNLESCACGRGLPRIGDVQGRIQAVIIGSENQFVPGSFFARLFADYEYAIRQFQVVQEEPGKLKFNIVKATLFEQGILDKIIIETKKYLGEKLAVEVNFIENVELGRTGKRQHSVSKVQINEILNKINNH